jgi:hypothetical protein
MKRLTPCGTAASLLCVGLLTAGGAAVAQDTRSQAQEDYSTPATHPSSRSYSPSSKPDVMKECVERERAGDSTMSEPEARKACHDALRAERENQDNEPQPPHNR